MNVGCRTTLWSALALWFGVSALVACDDDASPPACVGHDCIPHEHPDAGSDWNLDGGVTYDARVPDNHADAGADDAGEPIGYAWDLPAWFPMPVVPEDNPMADAKVELGRHLFYDTRLSLNQTQSCASCHQQALAFSDGRATAIGSTGQAHPRNSPGLANVAFNASLGWGNPLLLHLEQQVLVPLFGFEPVELGFRGKDAELFARLRAEPRYQALFSRVFADDDPFTLGNMVKALSAFQRTLISGNSAYDRFLYGRERDAISESAKRGGALFNSERLECFHCHNGFLMTDSVHHTGKSARELRFHNTGLYNIDGRGAYPAPNTGVNEVTLRPEDMGRFRAPSLRNVALTAPYMHDGSIATLSQVIDHYAAGGRTISEGPNAGDGSRSPFKSAFIVGFEITEQERADLIAFLESLTDESFVTDRRFSDPWLEPCALCEAE